MPDTPGSIEKRNFIFNVIEGSLWLTGGSFISSQTVLPALINRFGGGNLEVGLLGVVIYLALFLPQIFAARYARTMVRKKPLIIGLGFAQRGMILLMALTVLFLGAHHHALALWLFLFFFTINQAILGVSTPLWFDFLTKLTRLQIRGRLLGIRNSLAGILSLAASLMLTWLLSSFIFPLNYGLAFCATFLIQIIAIGFQASLVEDESTPPLPLQPMKEYISDLVAIVKENRAFKSFLYTCVFLILATMPMGFFTVYAINRFDAGEGMIGTFTLFSVAGQIVGPLLNGYLADRFGNKIALISASLSMFCSVIFALFAPSMWLFLAVFFFSGIFLGSEMMIRYNLAVEYGHAEHRATYVGLMNTLLSPLYFSGLIGGILCNALGYHSMFGIGLAFSIIGMILLFLRVKEPRDDELQFAD